MIDTEDTKITPYLKKSFEDWLETQTIGKGPDFEDLKERVGVFLKQSVDQSVQEYMLMRKYNQLHDIYNPTKTTDLFGNTQMTVPDGITKELRVKNDIWVPDPDKRATAYEDLEPELLLCNKQPNYNSIFNSLRLFTSTGENNNNIGRNLYYVIRDKSTQKYLGTMNLSSDYLDVKCRDSYIGWTREQRNAGMINHTSVGSIIVPTQPLGYNYVGGKLLSLLLVSTQVQDDWEELYKDKLVALTTTSFFGTFSQYTGLKYWQCLGKSMGSSIARPYPDLYAEVREWLKVNHTYKYWEWYHGNKENGDKLRRDHINRSMSFAFSKMGYKPKDFITGHQRGIHFCHLYENTADFLRQDITVDKLVRRFDNSLGAMTELWKTKYASKRIKSLLQNDRYLDEILFYDDCLTESWDAIKEKYLPQVGR